MKYGNILALGATLLALSACDASNPARQRQTAAVNSLSDQGDRLVGMPGITNFQQKRLVRDIYERTDKATITYAYVQGLDGRLTCLGQGIGYGVPYGTRSTPPESTNGVYQDNTTLAQPEPNGLYLPDNASASWWQMLNPETGKIDVIYLEPNVVISPFKIKSAAVAANC